RHPQLVAVPVLEAHVGRARPVLTHKDGAETGRDADLLHRLHLEGDLVADLLRQRGAVEDAGGHQWRKCLSPVRTMAMPCSSAAATTSSSRSEPPGWTTPGTPALATTRHAARSMATRSASCTRRPPSTRRKSRRSRSGAGAARTRVFLRLAARRCTLSPS